MPLIDERAAELPACLCRVGQHIFRVGDISYERLEGIIFQIFRQIIDVLEVKVEILLAYICSLGQFFNSYLFDWL